MKKEIGRGGFMSLGCRTFCLYGKTAALKKQIQTPGHQIPTSRANFMQCTTPLAAFSPSLEMPHRFTPGRSQLGG